MSLKRWILMFSVFALFAAPLAACGKKARSLDPADGNKDAFPRSYPSSK